MLFVTAPCVFINITELKKDLNVLIHDEHQKEFISKLKKSEAIEAPRDDTQSDLQLLYYLYSETIKINA